ncbi:MAG: acyltransferase [Acidobacteriaceae bacterium]
MLSVSRGPEVVKTSAPEHKIHKFHTLDALRGIAALAVVAYHRHSFLGVKAFSHGYLAVDFFFMLSGFVLTFAYQAKLDSGWSTWAFMKVRFGRLYPLYFLGLLVGLIEWFPGVRGPDSYVSRRVLAIGLVLGTLMLPTPWHLKGMKNAIFPINGPAWSLFFEVAANCFHALILRRRDSKLVPTNGVVVLVCSTAAFAITSIHMRTVNLGWAPGQILAGCPRVIFSYVAGFMLFLVWKSRRFRFAIPPAMSAAVLIAVLAIPTFARGELIYELATTMILFPILLFGSASSKPSPRLMPVAANLGLTSYAVYMLHEPLGELFVHVWNRLPGQNVLVHTPMAGIVYLLLVFAFALIAERFYDRPARAFLGGLLFRRSKVSSTGNG